MQWTEGVPSKDWDKSLTAAGGHFLQSSHWAAFQSALGRKVFYAYGASWQCLAIVERARTGARLYCPYGPLAKSQKGLASALEALRQLAKAHGAVFVRMEPLLSVKSPNLRALGLKPAFKDIQPRHTWVQDLTKTEEELLADMTATNRNLWRTHVNKGLSLRASTVAADVDFFIGMMKEVAAHNQITPHPDHYYKTMANILLTRGAGTIYLAEHQGEPVASAICFDGSATRYYAHAAARFAARRLHPGSAMLVQMILDAKTRGQRQFDFVGVAPPDAPPAHRWAGLTKFKQSFGGEHKAYLGTWELPASHLRHRIYRAVYALKNY